VSPIARTKTTRKIFFILRVSLRFSDILDCLSPLKLSHWDDGGRVNPPAGEYHDLKDKTLSSLTVETQIKIF
jgi:hypothetical protein